LLGTIAALRDEAIKKIEIRITDKKTKNIGFVVYGLFPKMGGKLKSAVLGGTNPPCPSKWKMATENSLKDS
jgi:hypothetical protein